MAREVKKLIICANTEVPNEKTKELDDANAKANNTVNPKTEQEYFFTKANFADGSGDEVKLLRLGDCWTSEAPKSDAVWSWAMQSGNDVTTFTVTLTGVKFNKRMFAPGGLELTFEASCQLSDASAKPIPLSMFINRNFIDNVACYVDAFGVMEGVDPTQVNSKEQIVYFSQNYYVHDVFVKSKGSMSHTFILKCYSVDNILKMTSYCKVYSGKCFGKDITTEAVDSLLNDVVADLKTLGADNDFKLYDFSQDAKKLSPRLMMMAYSSAESDNLKHRAEHDQKDSDNDKYNDTELRHPYLVQYNESFYDFMARVTHRCGEFLYFEKGMITLGLPYDTWALLSLSELPSDENIPLSSPFCTYQSISSVIGKDVTGFHKDYVNGMAGGDSEVSYRYDIQNAADEDLHTVIDSDNVIEPAGAWFLWTALGTFFTSEELLDGMVEALEEIVKYGCMTGITEAFVEDDYKKHTEESAQISSNVGIADTEIVTADTGIDDIENLCNNFFHTVEVLETKAERKKVSMDFSSNLPDLYLGSPVNLKDGLSDYYIITGMSGEYVSTDSEKTIRISAEGVPVMPNCFTEMKYVALPERGDIPHSREVSPMEAVVMDNVDPLRLGRVRVRYPWESEDGGWSPWIRITVPFTGNPGTGGFTMTPEIGEHVMLNYVNGNIERPFVEGSLYYREYENGDWTVNKPEIGGIEETDIRFFKTSYKVRSILSAKGHGLMIEDGTDKDILSAVLPGFGTVLNIIGALMGEQKFNLSNVDSEGEMTINGGQITLMDGSGFCEIDIIPTQRQINISSCWGAVSIDAFTGITLNAPNGNISIRGKNVSIEAGNNLSLKAGSNISDEGRITKEGVAEAVGRAVGDLAMELGNAALMEATGIDLKGACDLSFLRAVYEIIIRPVEGTMRIGSKRNVVMTAGEGNVDIPKDLMANIKKHNGETYGDTAEKERHILPMFDQVSERITRLNTVCADFIQTYDIVALTLGQIHDVFTSSTGDKKVQIKSDVLNKYDGKSLQNIFQTVKGLDEFYSEDNFFGVAADKRNVDDYKRLKGYFDCMKGSLKKLTENFVKNEVNTVINKDLNHDYDVDISKETKGGDKVPAVDTGGEEVKQEKFFTFNSDVLKEAVKTFNRYARRSIIIQCLAKLCAKDSNVKVCKIDGGTISKDEYVDSVSFMELSDYVTVDDNKWAELAKRLKYDSSTNDDGWTSFGKGIASGLASFVGLGEYNDDGKFEFAATQLINREGEAGPRAWNCLGSKGNIMISNESNAFTCVNSKSDGWISQRNNDLSIVKELLNQN